MLKLAYDLYSIGQYQEAKIQSEKALDAYRNNNLATSLLLFVTMLLITIATFYMRRKRV